MVTVEQVLEQVNTLNQKIRDQNLTIAEQQRKIEELEKINSMVDFKDGKIIINLKPKENTTFIQHGSLRNYRTAR